MRRTANRRLGRNRRLDRRLIGDDAAAASKLPRIPFILDHSVIQYERDAL
jgi:hypothetical protein